MNRNEARRRLGLPDDGCLILFPYDASRKGKRHSLAEKAVSLLRDAGRNIQLLTVSNVPNEKMPWYYNAADAMILCSESEGSPTAVKEALACGLPLVSTDVGDIREMTAGIPNARICVAAAEALAQGLADALSAPPPSSAAARTALSRYDQRTVIGSLERLYRTVASASSATPSALRGRLWKSLLQIAAHSFRLSPECQA